MGVATLNLVVCTSICISLVITVLHLAYASHSLNHHHFLPLPQDTALTSLRGVPLSSRHWVGGYFLWCSVSHSGGAGDFTRRG